MRETPEKADMDKPKVTIDNWAVIQRRSDLRYEELQPGSRLMGVVFGHSDLPDTEFICTSPIVRVDASQGLVETRNTLYQLGRISDGYKVWEQTARHGGAAA
jgi:hypothetical protein